MTDAKDIFKTTQRKSSISATRKTSDDCEKELSSVNEDGSVGKLEVKNRNNKFNLSNTILDSSLERILKSVEEAMIYKSKGNTAFKNKNYEEALYYYNKVIHNNSVHRYFQ